MKTAELASLLEAEIEHLLGLLKVKAENLRGILIVAQVKLEKKRQKSHCINILHATDKKFSRQLPIVPHCWKISYKLWLQSSPDERISGMIA